MGKRQAQDLVWAGVDAAMGHHWVASSALPGRTVNHMTGAYRGKDKTDARDAHVVAETARQRPRRG